MGDPRVIASEPRRPVGWIAFGSLVALYSVLYLFTLLFPDEQSWRSVALIGDLVGSVIAAYIAVPVVQRSVAGRVALVAMALVFAWTATGHPTLFIRFLSDADDRSVGPLVVWLNTVAGSLVSFAALFAVAWAIAAAGLVFAHWYSRGLNPKTWPGFDSQ